MNFSLQQPATAAPPAATKDLPPLQRTSGSGPVPGSAGGPRRRRSPLRSLLLIGGLLGSTALVLLVAGVPIPGAGRLNKTVSGLFASSKSEVLVFIARKLSLPVSLIERGTLESSNNKDVYNEVEGQTTIIKILDEGTPVKKGELVCELDSAQLRDNLDTQKIATEGANANLENARKTLEVAEISVKEYEEGTYKQELESAEGAIILAKGEIAKAKDTLDWSEKMLKFGYVPETKVTQDKLAYKKADISLKEANTKMRVLKEFTYGKTLTELRAEVEKALADKLAKETTYNLEKQKEDKLRRQIEKCKMYAPEDGLIVYANDPNQGMRGNNAPQIEEGATVRERQKIFSLPDITHMQVNTKVNEAMVDRVKRGQRCRVKIEAQAGEALAGTVEQVKPIADASSFFSSDVKVYTTIVTIDESPASLRPGMSAQVEILIEQLDDVMAVPVQAILSFAGKDHVFVHQGEIWDRREVKLGTTNDRLVEIKGGLEDGEEVALSPLSLMTEDEKNRVFGPGVKDPQAKDWSKEDAGKSKDAGKGGPEGGKAEKKGRGQGKGQGKGAGGPGGGGMPGFVAKLRNLSPEDRDALKSASEDDRAAILKKAGLTDDEMNQMKEMGRNFGGGGGMGGPPGGPGGGGGFGGPGGGPRP